MTRILMALSAMGFIMAFQGSPVMAEEMTHETVIEAVEEVTEEAAPELVCPEELPEGEEMSEECKEKMIMDAEKAVEGHVEEVMDSESPY